MELLKRLLVEEDGQGLVEYTLIVVLVALVFWVAIKNTNIGNQLASGWSKVTACVGTRRIAIRLVRLGFYCYILTAWLGGRYQSVFEPRA